MAQSQINAADESDVTPAGNELLDFDDNTLKGEEKSATLLFNKFQCI